MEEAKKQVRTVRRKENTQRSMHRTKRAQKEWSKRMKKGARK